MTNRKQAESPYVTAVSLVFSRRVLLPSASVLAFAYLVSLIVSYVPLAATMRHLMKPADFTLIFFGYFAVATITRIFLTKLVEDLPVKLLLTFGLATSSAGILAISVGESVGIFVTGLLIAGIGHGVVFPITSIIIARFTNAQERNLANSLLLTYEDLGFLLGPLVSSVLVTKL